MGASLSRPDPSSPASVAEAAFNTARRGYHPDEVRAFLVAVAAELGRLQERERQLEAELRDARETDGPVELDDETVTNLLGEETLRVLQTARESASQIKIRAEDTAARILREANDEANRLRQDADVEAARRRQDAASDAEAEVALAKHQGREMVNEARAYRERVLADLERRTTLARQQIEELIHGRDRLLQVFERARLVAVDVTSELKAIDSPEELVNLTPTTGPVPIMVPTERRPNRPSGPDDAVFDATTHGDATHHDTTREAVEVDAAGAGRGGDDDARDGGADQNAAGGDVGRAVEPVDDHADRGEGSDDDVAPAVEPVDDHADRGEGSDDDVAPAVEPVDDAAGGEASDDDVAPAPDDQADAGDEDDAGDARRTERQQPDTNVVSLFRGRALEPDEAGETGETDAADAADTADAADDERPDVGGIFERLRQSVPDGQTSTPAAADRQRAQADADTAEADADAADIEAERDAFTRRDEALVPLIVAGARRLKRVLADEQNQALDTLRQGDRITELDDLVPSVDVHVATYVAALDEELQSAAAAGAGELGANDTKTLRRKLSKSGAFDAAEHHVRSALVGPLRDRLARAVSDGDGNNDDIAKRVRAVYREWKTQHIDDQLDDVFRSAYSGGLYAALDAGTRLVWTSDSRRTPCPDCEDNALAGEVVAGDGFPTGHRSAPAHPGCTCLALPVG